jgi:hypothetical protein
MVSLNDVGRIALRTPSAEPKGWERLPKYPVGDRGACRI